MLAIVTFVMTVVFMGISVNSAETFRRLSKDQKI